MLHEDDILNGARAQRVLNDKDVIRGYTDSCKSDDDDQPPAFFGGQVTLGQQATSMEYALSDFSTSFIVPVPQHRSQIQADGPIYVPVIPLKKKPRSLKASVRKARKFVPVRVSHEINDVKRFIWSVLIEGGRYEQLRRICASNNIYVPKKWKVHQVTSDISEKLLCQARQSRTKWAEKMKRTQHLALTRVGSRGDRRTIASAPLRIANNRSLPILRSYRDPLAVRKSL
jgi:hypothetical protein